MTDLVSKRAIISRDWEDFLNKYMNLCDVDAYDETKNPMGYVNLGTAVNNICNDLIYPKLSSDDVWFCDTSMLQYKEGYGTMRLRKALANVLNEFFEPHESVLPENIFCTPGVTSGIDILAHCLADPGEVFLVPTPMYGRICTDCKQRSLIDILPVPVITADNTEDFPTLTMKKIIEAYENALQKDLVVRGLLIINPNNPLGDVYSPELLMDILSFCHKHSLHVIVDEIYALTVFSETKKFLSVLCFHKLPDPERTHVLYGMSKDFGLAGLRIGAIHTTCKSLQKCLIQLCFLNTIPFPVMSIAAKYLEDIEWLKKYVATNKHRIAENFDFCVKHLEKIGLKVRDTGATFFLWVDFRHICGSSFDDEREFFEYLMEKAHLYIGPGQEFFCAQPGWFRIVFTPCPSHLSEGFKRLEKAVKEYQALHD